MREYFKHVLELTKPYRFRFAVGLFCGFLSGVLAWTLPLSLKMAVETVFPGEQAVSLASGAGATNAVAGATNTVAGTTMAFNPTNALAGTTNVELNATTNGPAAATQLPLGNVKLPHWLKKPAERVALWIRPPSHPSKLRITLVILFIPAAMFIRSLLAYLNVYFLAWVGIRAANDLRVRLFSHIMHMPLGFFNNTGTGDLMTRIEGANAVNTTITGAFSVITREPISIITSVLALVALDWKLTLFSMLVFPVCLVPVTLFGRKFRKSNSDVHGRFASLNKVMHESFTGIRVIKGYNLEETVVGEFRNATHGVTGFFMRAIRAGELPGPLIEFIGSLGVALVFAYFAFFGGHSAANSAGSLLFFFMGVFNLYAPVKNLSRLQHQLSLARAGVEPAYKLLATQSTLPEPAHPKPLKAQGAPIRFENVSFSYDKKPVLHNINLTIQPGQFVALVGQTGSGKTTLANLLLRFYDPTAGAVLIGDTDIRQVSSKDLRANIGVVTQTTILFNETIRHNIALGRQGATHAEIEAAAKHAYAHDFIQERPLGYNAPAGEKGVNLSGGQQQRIAIARAILKDAPILVLDEATSALDSEVERVVQQALESLMQNRTTICIAHRLTTIQNADLIVVLDKGRIVETGNHTELLKKRGIYCKLWELAFETSPAEA